MKAPVRLREDPSAPADVRTLLRRGTRSRALSSEVRERSIARLDRVLVLPAAAGLLVWLKGIAVAGVCVAGATAAVHVLPVLVRAVAHPHEFIPSAPATRPGRAVGVLHDGPAGSLGSPPAGEREPPAPDANGPSGAAAPTSLGAGAAPTSLGAGAAPTSLGAGARSAGAMPRSAPPVASSLTAAPGARDVRRATAPLSDGPPPAPSDPALARDPLEREAAMLEDARAALDRDPRRALAQLERHASLFPDGRLAMERELLAVEALRRLGRLAEARARGERLLEQAAGSIYEPRVRAMLDGLEAP